MPAARPAIAETPTVMRTTGWADYALLDCGGGRKLERYGRYRVVRPEPQCLWAPRAARARLGRRPTRCSTRPTRRTPAAGAFARPAARDLPAGLGRGAVPRPLHRLPPPGLLPRAGGELGLAGRAGARGAAGQPRVLNLFGYTGVASLVCAAAGAAVTHVDASKKAVAWARENAELSGLADRPMRWIVEDARKYVAARGAARLALRRDHPRPAEVRPRARAARSGGCSRTCPSLSACAPSCCRTTPRFLLLNAYAERISGAVARRACWPRSWPAAAGASTGASWRWSRRPATAADRASFFARWTRVSARPSPR